MRIHIDGGWIYFCLAFGVMLLTSIIMERQSRSFYTRDVVLRKFSMMDLEFPSTATELSNLISGIYALPVEMMNKSLRSLKGQLIIDFLFMPATYGAIFLLCMKIAWKMTGYVGQGFFAFIAWAQVAAFIFDIIENIYLLRKIKKGGLPSTPQVHKAYGIMESFKWGIALTATICSFSGVLYFWLAGNYSIEALQYLLIILGEIVVFLLLAKFAKSKQDDSPETIVAV